MGAFTRLVLGRREGEEILVDGPARIRLDQITRGRCHVCIEAPASTKILRGELVARDRPPCDESQEG